MENQPVMQPTNPKKFPVAAVLVAVVVTAVIVGGGVYWWQNTALKAVEDKLITAQNNLVSTKQSFEQQVSALQEQITKLEREKSRAVTLSDEYIALMDQLNETKLKFAIFSWWQTGPEGVFKDPQDKNKFYFVTNHRESPTVTVGSIWVYDFTKDESFQKDGTVSALHGSTLLLSERLSAEREFRSVGIADDKFIFAETHFEDTPGPCATPWISYNNMYYIDLSVENPIKRDYTLSEEQRAAEMKKFKDCQNSLE